MMTATGGEEESENSVEVTAETRHVVGLREALRDAAQLRNDSTAGDSRRIQASVAEAAAPLIESLYRPLLTYCEYLVRSSTVLRDRVEGVDIAQDAWVKLLRYLREPQGDRVNDDIHLMRILRRTAKTRFLDLVGSSAVNSEQRPSDTQPDNSGGAMAGTATPYLLRLTSDDRYQELVTLLFTDELAFRKACRTPVRRRIRQYQALVLYQLGLHLWNETCPHENVTITEQGVVLVMDLMRRFVALLGVPSDTWGAIVEEVVMTPENGIEQTLLDAVNRLCETDVRAGNMISVLRYEMNGFIAGKSAGAEKEKR